MAFPEWMGPNIEARHVAMMGWGTDPAPPIGAPPVRELSPGEESRYSKTYRFVGLVGGKQLVAYVDGSFDKAQEALSGFGRVDRLMRIDLDRRGGIWLDGGDCVLIADNEPARKKAKNPNGL